MATLGELTDGYTRLNTRLVKSAGRIASDVFLRLGSWRDEDITRYVQIVQPQVDGLKLQAAQLQAVYSKEVAKASGQEFTPVPIRPAEVTVENLRNGVTAAEVYRRPFATMYTALSAGKQVSDAIAQGAQRAASIASTDITLASRLAGDKQRQNNGGVKFYKRVLSGAENCALCAIASTQRYKVGNLMPIHPGCDCVTQDFYADSDPGQVIDRSGLESLHEALQQQLGVSDRDARSADIGKFVEYKRPDTEERLADFTEIIVTREHGEYGPTLSWRNQDFTGPADVPAALDTSI